MRRLLALALAACVGADVRPFVIDLHVDLPHALYSTRARLDDPSRDVSSAKLARGRVERLVLPLFVEAAYAKPPSRVREEYEATWRALDSAKLEGVRATLAFEGMDGFSDAPDALDEWVLRGACVFGPVHDHDNALAGSSSDPATEPPGRGLTDGGRALATRVLALGGVLDVAHASDASAAELVTLARAAGGVAIDSHTGMRALVPRRRTLPDDLARALALTGGVVAISVHSGHVSARAGEPATLDDVARHIVWAIDVVGASHVAIGSDYDGLIVPPSDADGEASWPALDARLAARGVPAADRRAIFHDNAARVLGRCR